LVTAPGARSGVGLATRSDASGDVGAGLALADGLAFWCRWSDATAGPVDGSSIGSKEFYPILAFEQRFGHLLGGLVTHFTTDNLPNVYALNKGYTDDVCLRPMLRSYLEAAERSLHFALGGWLPRELNTLCDGLSKSRHLAGALALLGPTFIVSS
jgi:hypothetical protein